MAKKKKEVEANVIDIQARRVAGKKDKSVTVKPTEDKKGGE